MMVANESHFGAGERNATSQFVAELVVETGTAVDNDIIGDP